MKGLLKRLSPFAPDQSGAVSVLYDLGGIIVICDAGGCTGNICGFDEPRWFVRKSAIFSAGLRDMDAILGRDKRLVEKLKDVTDKTKGSFAALIGTPVPAVIATDFRALKRMAEKKCGVPVITVDCTGTRLYDEGASDAYMELFETFAEDGQEVVPGRLGVIGATPLDTSDVYADEKIRSVMMEKGYAQVLCYGMGDDLDAVKAAGSAEKNLVIAPSGLKAARYLEKRFGTPYEIAYPILPLEMKEPLMQIKGKKVLVIHQQAAANEIRGILRAAGNNDVTAAGFFLQDKELKEPQDIHLTTEAQLEQLLTEGGFDVVIADPLLKRVARTYDGLWIDAIHFAVSGNLITGESGSGVQYQTDEKRSEGEIHD